MSTFNCYDWLILIIWHSPSHEVYTWICKQHFDYPLWFLSLQENPPCFHTFFQARGSNVGGPRQTQRSFGPRRNGLQGSGPWCVPNQEPTVIFGDGVFFLTTYILVFRRYLEDQGYDLLLLRVDQNFDSSRITSIYLLLWTLRILVRDPHLRYLRGVFGNRHFALEHRFSCNILIRRNRPNTTWFQFIRKPGWQTTKSVFLKRPFLFNLTRLSWCVTQETHIDTC